MRIDVNLPKSWSEIDQQQLDIISEELSSKKDKAEFYIRTMLGLLRWRVLQHDSSAYYLIQTKQNRKFLVNIDQIVACARILNFITADIQPLTFAPDIKGFAAPNPVIYNTTLEQYLLSDNLHKAFVNTEKSVYIEKIAGIYWRLESKSFDPGNIVAISLSKKQKMSVFIWFCGIQRYMVNQYPEMFSGGSSSNNNPAEVVLNLLSELNQGDVTRNEKIMNTHVHEVFFELNKLAIQNKKKNVHTI
jgi:hypothetical protein